MLVLCCPIGALGQDWISIAREEGEDPLFMRTRASCPFIGGRLFFVSHKLFR